MRTPWTMTSWETALFVTATTLMAGGFILVAG